MRARQRKMAVEPKIEAYREFQLVSEVLRFGIGGNLWKITVIEPIMKTPIFSASNEAYQEAYIEATKRIDKLCGVL